MVIYYDGGDIDGYGGDDGGGNDGKELVLCCSNMV